MKVLKQGKVTTYTTKPWWESCKHTCPKCNAQWILDESDEPDIKVTTERSPNGEAVVTSTCPTCGTRVQTRRSRANYLRGVAR